MDTACAYFGEVVRLGSIRQAAERLHVSASSVSRQIKKLEHAFEAELVLRHSQGIKLTPAGELVAHFVQSQSHEMQRLKTSLEALKALHSGHISLYTVEGAIGGLLPGALAAFSHRYPGITYDIRMAGTDDVMQAVAEDRCDIGLSFHPVPRHDVEAVATIAQPLYALVAPSHALAAEEQLELAVLGREPIGVPDSSFGIRHLLDHVIKSGQIEANIRLETNSIAMLRQFALHGMGLVCLPAHAFERELAAKQLVAVPLVESALSAAKLQICKRAEIELTRAAQQLVEVLVEQAHAKFGVARHATPRSEVCAS